MREVVLLSLALTFIIGTGLISLNRGRELIDKELMINYYIVSVIGALMMYYLGINGMLK